MHLLNTFFREISRASENLLASRDGFPNTSLVLVEHGYKVSSTQGNSLIVLVSYDAQFLDDNHDLSPEIKNPALKI